MRAEDGPAITANIFQRMVDSAVQQRSADLEDFFENAPVALHLVARDGTIVRANRAELDMLGYSAEEYIGRHITEFHADGPVIDDILKRLLRNEAICQYPARLRAKDGRSDRCRSRPMPACRTANSSPHAA